MYYHVLLNLIHYSPLVPVICSYPFLHFFLYLCSHLSLFFQTHLWSLYLSTVLLLFSLPLLLYFYPLPPSLPLHFCLSSTTLPLYFYLSPIFSPTSFIPLSLYPYNSSGMRPVCYSCKEASEKGIGWLRTGSAITYAEGLLGKENSFYYSLSFTIDFHHPKDTVLIAYSYPYTMSDYQAHMRTILNHPRASDVIRSSRLCTTLGGERCDLLVITDFKVSTPPTKSHPST